MEKQKNRYDFTKIIATLALVIGVCILVVQVLGYRAEAWAQEIEVCHTTETEYEYQKAPDTDHQSPIHDGLYEIIGAETLQEVVEMSTTAYTAGVACTGTITADGSKVRHGIAASSKAKLGWTAIVYANNDGEIGEVLGIYEIKDTGCGKNGSIKKEQCLDIYVETLDDVWEWMRLTNGKVWVQWVMAEG